jgi:hypothetical protein
MASHAFGHMKRGIGFRLPRKKSGDKRNPYGPITAFCDPDAGAFRHPLSQTLLTRLDLASFYRVKMRMFSWRRAAHQETCCAPAR